ncbi:MAG: aminotransferase class III-fold pyridoxal phosphate-dependent enzyme, partial [Pseudomonadota bacterium]
NPVSCAAAMATLDVIEDEGLQENARVVGAHALARLGEIEHPLKAEARGLGLFFGIEFFEADGTPATDFAARIVEGMKARGVLLNRIGRDMNTLKMRPPMPFGIAEADLAMDTLEEVLCETPHD